MTKLFGKEVVVAVVKDMPVASGYVYFFAKNGKPEKIFCHQFQGGTELSVTRDGRIVMGFNGEFIPPQKGEEIVLVRESSNSDDRGYTKAGRWVPIRHWHEVKWAMNAHQTYRVIGYNHRVNGQFTPSTNNKEILVESDLLTIVRKYNRDAPGDRLSPSYSNSIGRYEYTRDITWERKCSDGKWIECADPRPVHTPPNFKA